MARLKGVDYNVMGNAITGESSSSRDRIESSPGRCFVEGIHGLQSPVMVKGTVNMFILIYTLQKMTGFAHQSTVGPEQFSFFFGGHSRIKAWVKAYSKEGGTGRVD